MPRNPAAADIRVWAAEQGLDLAAKGAIPSAIRAAYSEAQGDQGEERPSEAAPETDEVAPQAPRRKFSLFGKKPEGEALAVVKKTHRRVSLDSLFSAAWGIGGSALVKTGADVPVGRILTWQAPVAGPMLDKAVKGTIIDKALQPLARAEAKGAAVGALLLPPLLVGAIERRPELYPMLAPILKMALSQFLVEMAPVVKRQKADEAKQAEAMRDLGLDGTTLDELVESLFAPVETEPADA